jgi:hypothetical protein
VACIRQDKTTPVGFKAKKKNSVQGVATGLQPLPLWEVQTGYQSVGGMAGDNSAHLQLRPSVNSKLKERKTSVRRQNFHMDLETNWLVDFVDPAMRARYRDFLGVGWRFRAAYSTQVLTLMVVTVVAVVPLLQVVPPASSVAALVVAAVSFLLSLVFLSTRSNEQDKVVPAGMPADESVAEIATFCSSATLVPACWLVMQTVCSITYRRYSLKQSRVACSLDPIDDSVELPNKSEVAATVRCGAIELQHQNAELTSTIIVLLAASSALEPSFKEMLLLCAGALACCIASVVSCEYISIYHSCEVPVMMLIACTLVGWNSRLREQAFHNMFLSTIEDTVSEYDQEFVDEEAHDPMEKMWVAVLQGPGAAYEAAYTLGRERNSTPTLTGGMEREGEENLKQLQSQHRYHRSGSLMTSAARRPSQMDLTALVATPAFVQLRSVFDGLGDYTSLDFNMIELENRTHNRPLIPLATMGFRMYMFNEGVRVDAEKLVSFLSTLEARYSMLDVDTVCSTCYIPYSRYSYCAHCRYCN